MMLTISHAKAGQIVYKNKPTIRNQIFNIIGASYTGILGLSVESIVVVDEAS